MEPNFDFELLSVPTRDDWVLLLPKSIDLDSNFFSRIAKLANEAVSSRQIFCGAGVYPTQLSVATSSLVSFCFDQVNTPTHSTGAFRVLAILESPILMPWAVFRDPIFSSIKNFKQLLDTLNREVRVFNLYAETNSLLTYGMNRRLQVQRLDLELKNQRRDSFSLNRKLSVVTRTTGSREEMLERCVESVANFSRGLNQLEVEHLIVFAGNKPQVSNAFNVFLIANEADSTNSRLGGLLAGIAASSGDYVLFLDDDDFLNADAAKEVEFILNFDIAVRITLFNSQQIFEKKQKASAQLKTGHTYRATNAMGSYFGPNRTPISSVIYPKQTLAELASISNLDQYPKVLEDHLMLILALKSSSSEVAYSSEILSWISIHGQGQTVLEQQPLEWIGAMSELRRVLAEDFDFRDKGSLLEVANLVRRQLIHQTSAFSRLLEIARPSFWRTVWNFNLPGRVFSGRVDVKELWLKYLSH